MLCRTPEKTLKLLRELMDMNQKKCQVKYFLVSRLGVSGGMLALLLSKTHSWRHLKRRSIPPIARVGTLWNVLLFSWSCLNLGIRKSLRLEKTSKSIRSSLWQSSTLPAKPHREVPCPLIVEHFQGWWLPHFPGELAPVLSHSFSEVVFPDIQPESPVAQLETISFVSPGRWWLCITLHQCKEL